MLVPGVLVQALLFIVTQLPQTVLAESYPPQHLLKELESRLIEAPACSPRCLSPSAAAISINNNELTLKLSVGAASQIAMPWPVVSPAWQPALLLNGKPSSQMSRSSDGQWLIAVDKGVHTITLKGQVVHDSVAIDFPLEVPNVSLQSVGWQADGLRDNRLLNRRLELSRQQSLQQKSDTLLADPIEPFIRVSRTLTLDREWTIQTRVSRIAPIADAINIRIPLLENEKITSADLSTEKDSVLVSLNKHQASLQWTSLLESAENYTLAHKSDNQLLEQWRINASPRWHIETDGLPSVKRSAQSPNTHLWRPRPGEQLHIHSTNPIPVEGPTITVESVTWRYEPGERSARGEHCDR